MYTHTILLLMLHRECALKHEKSAIFRRRKKMPKMNLIFTNYTWVSFFWDQSQDMGSSGFPLKKQGSEFRKKTDFNIIFMIWKERDLKYFPSFWGLCFGTWVVFFDWWYDGFNCSIKFLLASNDQNFVKSEEIHCAEIIRRKKKIAKIILLNQ